MILQNSPKIKLRFKRNAFELLFNAKKNVHDYETNSNQQSSRETRVEIKQKRERSEDFLHTNLVPRERENQEKEKAREQNTLC